MNATGGIISPNFDSVDRNRKLRDKLPETIFLVEKMRGSFTFEAPSTYDLQSRVYALATAILTAVKLLLEENNKKTEVSNNWPVCNIT